MNSYLPKLVAACFCLVALAGCGAELSVPPAVAPVFSDEQLKPAILTQATDADKTVTDGWFFGQEARLFKSGYRKTTPEQKTNFAMAYHKWIGQSKENLETDWKSFLPYSQRRDFARSWWSDPANDTEFVKQESKFKILWIHEALMDASELWWRAYEKLANDRVASASVIAHDYEQSLVFKYAESQHEESSLSQQPKEESKTPDSKGSEPSALEPKPSAPKASEPKPSESKASEPEPPAAPIQ